jgi:integrase
VTGCCRIDSPSAASNEFLDRVAAAAHVAPFTAHDFRRTVAGDLLEVGVDVATVQKLLGHASPVTTAGYDRRPAAARAKAARMRAVPYAGRAGS